MSSSEVLEILNAWKRDELDIFGFWASSSEKRPAVAFSFEGYILGADEEAILVSGDPSDRVKGSPRVHASFSLKGAAPSRPDPQRLRFTFDSGAILDIKLG